jgi:PAS domain S-box-containing protein
MKLSGNTGGKEVVSESCIDIPEHKKTEDALRESEERYRNIVEDQTEFVCRFLPDGTHLFVNDAYCRYFDTKRETIIGHRFRPLIHPDDREMVARHFTSLTLQSPVKNVDQRTIRRDGGIRLQRWSDRAIFDPDGRVIEYQSVGRDITEQKVAEEAQKILLHDLAMKNTELDRFTYTVSHDLKSPLITIKGFLEILKKDMKSGDTDRMHKDIERIHAATVKMENFISALLELSRIGRIANPPRNVSFASLVQEAAEILDTQIKERGVILTTPDEDLMIYGDRVRLLQVFSNLMENAVKFMGEQKEPRIEIRLSHHKGENTICMRDNGIGIAPENVARIFTIFERLNPGIAGSGIGLTLVKRIVEVHGGKCWVESGGLGKGSTFCFTLPESPRHEKKE